jgi:hypothetical protein
MRRNKVVVIIWLVVNLFLILKYLWDSISIKCETCLPGIECPPCQTKFMEYFWWYLLVWNIGMLLVKLITRKRN